MKGKSVNLLIITAALAALSAGSAWAFQLNIQVDHAGAVQRLVLGTDPGASPGYDASFDVPALFDGDEAFRVYVLNPRADFETNKFWREFTDASSGQWEIVLEGTSGADVIFSWQVDAGSQGCFLPAISFVDVSSGKTVSMLETSGYSTVVDAAVKRFKVTYRLNAVRKVKPPVSVTVKERGNWAVVSWDVAQGGASAFYIYEVGPSGAKKIAEVPASRRSYVVKKRSTGTSVTYAVQVVDAGGCRSEIKQAQ